MSCDSGDAESEPNTTSPIQKSCQNPKQTLFFPQVSCDSGDVESTANVTDIHEALHIEAVDPETDPAYPSEFGIWSVRWSGDGREIVVGTGDSSICIYDVEYQKVGLVKP